MSKSFSDKEQIISMLQASNQNFEIEEDKIKIYTSPGSDYAHLVSRWEFVNGKLLKIEHFEE
jgi:hypothetical protein